MSSYREIALKIPDEIRSARLMTPYDPIAKAVATSGNPDMQLLFGIWTQFIQPGVDQDMGCPKCLARMLTNFKQMKDELITLEREYKLLKALK